MKTELELNEKILGITNKIRTEHPEILKYLDEMPITVPYQENPEITIETLTTYHDSLLKLLKDYNISHTEDELTAIVASMPIVEIKVMESETAYQNFLTEIDGVSFSYNDVGVGEIPIIFLHGFPFDKSMWNSQLEHLKSAHRVIAIDLRGFGKSTDEKTPLSIDLFSKDLISFMDKLNIKKAMLCGLSMGGYIALDVLKKAPERFEALMLCDTQCNADTAEGKEKRYQTIEQIKQEGTTAFNEKFIKSVFHPDSLANKVELVERLQTVVLANAQQIITAGLVALAERAETCTSLQSIDIPTLIICGRQDELTPLKQSLFLQQNIKGASLKIIENAGHVSNLEQPEEFNKALVQFLDSLNISSQKAN